MDAEYEHSGGYIPHSALFFQGLGVRGGGSPEKTMNRRGTTATRPPLLSRKYFLEHFEHSQKRRAAGEFLGFLPFRRDGWRRKIRPRRYANGAEQAGFAQFEIIKTVHTGSLRMRPCPRKSIMMHPPDNPTHYFDGMHQQSDYSRTRSHSRRAHLGETRYCIRRCEKRDLPRKEKGPDFRPAPLC